MFDRVKEYITPLRDQAIVVLHVIDYSREESVDSAEGCKPPPPQKKKQKEVDDIGFNIAGCNISGTGSYFRHVNRVTQWIISLLHTSKYFVNRIILSATCKKVI